MEGHVYIMRGKHCLALEALWASGAVRRGTGVAMATEPV